MRAIEISPDRHSGEPVFAGTRVALRILLDYLAEGRTTAEFCTIYPGVSLAVVERALDELHAAVIRVAYLDGQRREVERLWDQDRHELAELRRARAADRAVPDAS